MSFGKNKILEKGQIIKNYSETELNNYMKSDMININIEINSGKKILLVIQWILQKSILKLIQIIEPNKL